MCIMNGSNDEKSIQRTEATVGKKFKLWQQLGKLVFQSIHNVSAAKSNNIAIGLEYIIEHKKHHTVEPQGKQASTMHR